MRYQDIAYRLPGPLRRHVLIVEAEIEDAVAALAHSLPAGARVLDAGAGGLVPTTVIDLTTSPPEIIRHGAGAVDEFR